MISRTDILIGLSHILYLPKNSGVIEIYPKYASIANTHFRAMSKWRGLRHINWMNQDDTNEITDQQTVIPKIVIQELVIHMKEQICEDSEKL